MEEYTVRVYEDRTTWLQEDQLHRLDGPAVERTDGSKSWWIKGVLYTEEEFNEKVNPVYEFDGYKVKYIRTEFASDWVRVWHYRLDCPCNLCKGTDRRHQTWMPRYMWEANINKKD